jgi:group II intron reverse transcriptase/maturase
VPLEDLYRQLFNPELYRRAYGKIAPNAGAMTPGVTDETVDGMSQERIRTIIQALRYERYVWKPARRVYIEKKNSNKKRPLGIPTWGDKLLQEVIRLLLEAYYEPQFSDRSHGFRPGRGCHTALTAIRRTWQGTVWFIEGDISRCFDSLDHAVLMSILAEKLHDNRFLRLIHHLLQAGYLEEWNYHATYSGTPQGGVVSPILANIYLDRLDQFVETELLPVHNHGHRREDNPEYRHVRNQAEREERQGNRAAALRLRKQSQQLPSVLLNDPGFRRLRYLRYADDFLLGYVGTHHEAEQTKQQIGEFLRNTLHLELSEEKTLITHGRTEAARFLGYEIVVLQDDRKHTANRRSINGAIGLKVPRDVIEEKCRPYTQHGQPIHRIERIHDTEFTIVYQYQQVYRGIVQYYQLAFNLHQLDKLKWVMEQSLTKTLARKLQISVPKVYDRFGTQIKTEEGVYKLLQVAVERKDKKPLIAQWGGIPLRWRKDAILDDQPHKILWRRTELLQRFLADECELCGSHETVQVHHIRALKDLQTKGRSEIPTWVTQMAERHRKTLVVCLPCHQVIHQGEPTPGTKPK